MNPEQRLADDVPFRRYENDDAILFAADLGGEAHASVDVVGDTAIVVAGEDQYDLDLPGDDAQAFIRNGVLTVEVTSESQED